MSNCLSEKDDISKVYTRVETLRGCTSIKELIQLFEEDVFFYGETDFDSENALLELKNDGFEEQAEIYSKYCFDGYYILIIE